MKKIFSAFLLMTMMVASVGSFVSCSDIEDAIAKVEGTATENAAQIKDLEGKIAALQTALATAQADAAAAKAEANAAKQAAATAKAEAIEAALAEIAKVQDDVDAANAEIKKINDALAGKATKEAVELLESTMEKYSALTDKNADAIEAIKAELAALKEAGVTAEAFAKVVADMKKVNEDLVNFVKVIVNLASQIQDVTFVPENTDGSMTAKFYAVPSTKTVVTPGAATTTTEYETTPLHVRATYEISPKNLAGYVTSENVYFSTVATKAASAEYFTDVVVEEADSETGRVTVKATISKDSDAYKVITGTVPAGSDLANAGYDAVAFSLNIADSKPETIGEAEIETGSFVQSAYVKITDNAMTKLENAGYIVYQGIPNYASIEEHQVVYTTAKADSKRDLFNTTIVYYIDGKYMTEAQAEEFLGIDFTITTGDAKLYAGSALPATLKFTQGKLDSTVEFKKALDVSAVDNSVVYTVDEFYLNGTRMSVPVRNNGVVTMQNLYTVASYEVTRTPAGIVFSDLEKEWNYKEATPEFKHELTVTGVDNINDVLNGATEFEFYGYNPAGALATYKLMVTPKSSKVVEVTNASSDNIPYFNKPGSYDFYAEVSSSDNKTTYYLGFTVKVAAKPANKTIDLGSYTITAYKNNATVSTDVELIKAIYDTDKTFFGAATYADIVSYFVDNATKDNAKSSVVITNGATSDNAEFTIAKKYQDNNTSKPVVGETSKIVVSTPSAYNVGYDITTVYNVYGVEYKVVAKVQLESPAGTIALDPLHLGSGNVANINGQVTVPTFTATAVTSNNEVTGYNYTLATKTNANDFVLDVINLANYVKVTLPEGANYADYTVEFKLTTEAPKDANNNPKTTLPELSAGQTKATVNVVADPVTGKPNVADAVLDMNETKLREFAYDATLKLGTTALGKVSFTVKVPQLVYFTAPNVVSKVFQTGTSANNTINVAGALKVVDKDGKAIYNPYAKDLTELFDGYSYSTDANGNVIASSIAAGQNDAFVVYGQTVKLNKKDGKAIVKTYLNGAPYDYTHYTITDNGTITITKNDAPISSALEFHVEVVVESIYGNLEPQVQTAVVKFTPAN